MKEERGTNPTKTEGGTRRRWGGGLVSQKKNHDPGGVRCNPGGRYSRGKDETPRRKSTFPGRNVRRSFKSYGRKERIGVRSQSPVAFKETRTFMRGMHMSLAECGGKQHALWEGGAFILLR